MAKLTKEQSKKHTQVMELVNSDRALTYDEKVFILENYHESQGQLNSLAGAFFTPPGLAQDFSIEVPDNCSVIDLCAGIGALSFPLIHHYNTKREITCVERCVEYVQVGRRILPEATWINDDVFDREYPKFDVAISNPPFGRIKEDTYKGAYTGGEFEYKVIELASRIAKYGVFILPQQSAPFAYSGVRQYEKRVSGKCAKFIEQTGIFLNPGFACVIWTWNGYAAIKCVFRDTMDVFNDIYCNMSDYEKFLKSKIRKHVDCGFTVDKETLPPRLFPFQRDIVAWALKRGRAAIFAQTGLGKSFMESAWANAVHEHTGGNVLILAPLAVAGQMVREATKFGIPAKQCSEQSDVSSGITVTNYEKLHKFDLSKFVGVVLDESSILKSFDGKTRTMLIDACKDIPFRLCATATPAPNDFTELGNHSEFLGVMSVHGMQATFFAHDASDTGTWRLRGHAEDAFWEWMCSWSVLIRKPSDLGYEDDAYDLPPLETTEHIVQVEGDVAKTLSERLKARRNSIEARVQKAAELTPDDGYFVWWCNLNDEAEALCRAIPGAVEIRGSDKEEEKERKLNAFSNGEIRVLVTKAKIAGFGMNWQHCNNTGFVGMNDSFEQCYQAIRRFWRFGQTKPVNVHYVVANTESAVMENIKRKEAEAERMGEAMVAKMADISSIEIRSATNTKDAYNPTLPVTIPGWIEVGY